MLAKKILVVSPSFYPQLSPRSFRTTELVKELARQGHEVILYTIKDAAVHDPLAKDWNITINDLGSLRFPRIHIKHPSRLLSLVKRVLNRVLLMLCEYPDIELMFKVNHALKYEKGYDLLISIAVPFPVHWGVAKALSKNGRLTSTWVADCGDPFMGNKADSFKKLFYFKYVEKWFCRMANYITVPSEGSIDAYYPEFHSKIKVIPQGFDFEETPVYKGEINNEVPTFAYAGGFIAGIRDPKELLVFLSECGYAFKFIIYTNNRELVEPFLDSLRNRIELRTYVPRQQLLFELSKMDFLVNFNNGTAVQTPSKLIDYAIANRPVLTVDTGKLDKTVVNEFLSGDYSNQFNIGDIEQYKIQNVAAKFAALCKD